MELQLFDEVGEVLRGLVPGDLGELRCRHHRYGIKVSETWPDPDLGDPDLPMELAARLTDYITALEPLRSR